MVAESTYTSLTYKFAFSAFSSVFVSQLAIADFSSFSIFVEASLFENFKTLKALFTSIPRIMSATRRILRGDVGTFLSLAK
jgi:hypothetical protein